MEICIFLPQSEIQENVCGVKTYLHKNFKITNSSREMKSHAANFPSRAARIISRARGSFTRENSTFRNNHRDKNNRRRELRISCSSVCNAARDTK